MSVQSIIGATLNRHHNILILFHFIISSGIADFWANRNLKPTFQRFSFPFQATKQVISCLSTSSRVAPYCAAVLEYLVQYCVRSCLPSLSLQNRVQPSLRLALQYRGRVFGGRRVRKRARYNPAPRFWDFKPKFLIFPAKAADFPEMDIPFGREYVRLRITARMRGRRALGTRTGTGARPDL